jgi:hypothetical protein
MLIRQMADANVAQSRYNCPSPKKQNQFNLRFNLLHGSFQGAEGPLNHPLYIT